MKVAFYDNYQFAFETKFDKEDLKSFLRLVIPMDSNSLKLKTFITKDTNFGNSSGHDCDVIFKGNTIELATNEKRYEFKSSYDLNRCEFFNEYKGNLVQFTYTNETRFIQVHKECDTYLEGNDATETDWNRSYRKFLKHKISDIKILSKLC